MKNSEFKPTKLYLKIDLVSHPACAEGLGKFKYWKVYLLYFYNVWLPFVIKMKSKLYNVAYHATI